MQKLFVIAIVILLSFSLFPNKNSLFEINKNKIDNFLLKRFEKENNLEVLVQFKDEVKKEDINKLKEIRIEILKTYGKESALPLVFAKATKEQVLRLSSYERTFWIEGNNPLKYYLDVSAQTINATQTNERVVKSRDNETILQSITGKGITVAVVDSGIDATHPDLPYKTKVLKNLKRDTQYEPWRESEDTDTSSGHGTHVAGTVAGDGRASALRYRGIAPDATLIGLSMGEAPFTIDEYDALDWVYQNSRPNANPDNIRVATNSWGPGTGDELDPEDAIKGVIEKLTYENNVVVAFAAGNEGENNHEGETSTTNIYSNVPSAISVAAAWRNGTGLADFSSRGDKSKEDTWPEIATPGVSIMSSADRGTMIGGLTADQPTYYYFAISGTSMATPHTAGTVALLFQACPSLRISEKHDDYSGNDTESWNNNPKTRIHEVEWILKATADYILPSDDNGVPENSSESEIGKHDFAQGYGLVNVEKAVAVALVLNELRKFYNASVEIALNQYENIITQKIESKKTDTLATSWYGMWAMINNQSALQRNTYYSDQTRYVFIPNNASVLSVVFNYIAVKMENGISVANIELTIDFEDDGVVDYRITDVGGMSSGNKQEDLELTQEPFASQRGKLWKFNIEGEGVEAPLPDPTLQNKNLITEYTVDYDVSLQLFFEQSVFVFVNDTRTTVARWKFAPALNTTENKIEMLITYYDLTKVDTSYFTEEEEKIETPNWFYVGLALIIGGFLIGILATRKKFRK